MLLYMKMFIYAFVCIAVAGQTDPSESESFERFKTIFYFTDGLKNGSDNIIEYVTKIQALFCPEQPICTTEGDRNSTVVLKTLPKMIGIGTDVTRMEDVHKIVGACCLPCSCNTKTCKENGNCCLSKIFSDALKNSPDIDDQNPLAMLDHLDDFSESKDENVTTVYSECIKASWLSYRDKDDLEIIDNLDVPGYFMITRCFENTASHVDVTKCQTPSDDDVVMRPVVSSDTGRIYWNSYCARCNNDDRHISPWTASVKFKTDIAFFVNYSDPTVTVYPDTYDGIPEFVSKTGSIVYAPPIPQEDKLCLRKKSLLTCEDLAYEPKARPKDSWLEIACERIYNPLIIESAFGTGLPLMNIFCYLCLQQYIKPSVSRHCGYGEHLDKSWFAGMSALLDFKAADSNENPLTVSSGQDKCRCDEVFDDILVSTISVFALFSAPALLGHF